MQQLSRIPETYGHEDVQQILQLAIARKPENGEFSRTQLVEMAQDLGISPQNLDLAEKEWLARQGEFEERHIFHDYRRNKLKKNFIRYGIVNSFLLLLSLVAFHSAEFALSIALVWGLGLALSAWKTFELEGEDYEIAFKAWRVKQQIGQSINTTLNKWLKPQQGI